MGKDDILRTLKRLRPEIQRDYNAVVVGIFGSYARGDQRPDSDLDILATFTGEANLLDLVGLSDFLEDTLHCKVDIVSQGALRDEIRPTVLNELVRV